MFNENEFGVKITETNNFSVINFEVRNSSESHGIGKNYMFNYYN
jgi:hypothetical protein